VRSRVIANSVTLVTFRDVLVLHLSPLKECPHHEDSGQIIEGGDNPACSTLYAISHFSHLREIFSVRTADSHWMSKYDIKDFYLAVRHERGKCVPTEGGRLLFGPPKEKAEKATESALEKLLKELEHVESFL
jgi:hypothetical protein